MHAHDIPDPLAAHSYKYETFSVTANVAPSAAVGRDPNRVAIILTLTSADDLTTPVSVFLCIPKGSTNIKVAGASQHQRTVVLSLRDYGPVIGEELLATALGTDVDADITTVSLSHRDD